MNISKDKVVSIAYTLKNLAGEIIDSSEEGNPLVYVHGNGYLISGLEAALEGKEAGAELSVTVEPKDAYGEYEEALVFEVSKDQFPEDVELEVGMEFQADNGQIVAIKEVNGDKIKIDTNHPMAGQTLCFEVKVVEVRELSEEELAMMSQGGCGGCGGCGGDCSSGDCNCDGGCGCSN